MREIKFRYKVKGREELLYDSSDDFIYLLNTRKVIAGSKGEIFIVEHEMQYTGHTDKNKKEMYDGDIIVYNEYGSKGLIQWLTEEASFAVVLIGEKNNFFYLDELGDSFEILGNKHNNPELMEGDEK